MADAGEVIAGTARQRRGRAGVAALLRHPADGWQAIADAPVSTATLLGLAAPLAAIGPVARMIHALAFGSGSMGIIQYRPTVGGAIATAVVGWLTAMLALWLLALAIDVSSPWFGGRRDRVAATRVAVFGSTAWWLASGFAVLPAIDFLQVLGLYSLALLFVGAPLLMRADEARRSHQGLTAAIVAAVLVAASLVAAGVVGRASLRPTYKTAHGREVVTNAPAIPGSRLVAPAADKRHAVAPGTAAVAAGAPPIAASSLAALLPDRIGGFTRTASVSQTSVSAGIASADAKATYVEGTDSFTLAITDAGQPGALATDNSVVAGQIDRVTDSGYQRSRVVGGVRVSEKWNNADHGGSYARSVAGRFTVEAQGTAPAIDVLKGAVALVDERRLAALSR